MVIDTFGRVGIQTSTPVAPLDVAQTNGSSNFTVVTTNYGNPNDVLLSRAQGTITAPTLIGSGDTGVYSRIIARGYDGAFFRTAAQIAFEVDAATGSGDMPGRITFFTTPDGSTTTVERMRIEQTGEVGIGVLNPLRALHIGGLTNSIRIDGLATGGSFITAPSATTDKIMYADANGDVRTMAAGTTGQLLTYTAAGPAWSTATSNDWSITGNAGLSAATNFLGTTDNTDVLIKRQNEEALRVYPGGTLIGIGNTSTGVVPLAGFGTRLMWAPAKAAFRAGSINGAQWDNANVGAGSAAFGANNTASGVNAFVSGSGNTVSGQNSVAFGNSNTVTATHALVSGNSNNAAGNYSVVFNNTASSTAAATTSMAGGFQSQTQANLSIAIGWADTAKGVASVAIGGFSNEARSDYSFAAGNNNLASANQAVAFGNNNVASGTNAFVAGSSNTVSNAQSAAFGVTNTVSGTNSLVAGSTNTVSAGQSLVAGFSNNVSGDVSVVAGSSNIVPSIRSMVSGANNDVAGENNLVGGFQNQIAATYGHSIVVGYQDTLSASSSAVFGFLNKVTAFTGFAMGDRNLVTGQTSSAFGYQNVASGTNSFVTGQQDTTLGNLSSAFGTGNRAASFNEMAIGMYGTQYTAASASAYNATDRIFNVGNGTAAGSRSDAFTILKGGNVGIGTNNPLQRLHVNGLTNGVRIGGLATGGSFITATSATTDKLLYANANGDVRAMTAGSTGQVLTYTASGPAWSTATSNDWGITGNASTVDGTNFLGTTDNIPFTIRVNNQRSGRIDNTNHNATWGYRAGSTLSTGTFNTLVGDSAGYTMGTNIRNTALGASALRDLSSLGSGKDNVAIGVNAMRDVANAEKNVAVGNEALRFMFSGYGDNVAIGDSAGHNSRWDNNIAIGSSTLLNANTNGYNIAIGTRALYNLNAPSPYMSSNNVAIGYRAMYSTLPTATTDGNNNTSVGNYTLTDNTTGYSNAALGYQSLWNNTNGYENTAVGNLSLENNTTGDQNVSLGSGAGTTNTTGNANTLLGYNTETNANNLSNSAAIGANARVDASNSMVLGSVNGVNGATATVSVGIGVNAPLRTLHVGGLTNGIRYTGVATGGSFITAPSATTDKIVFADANGDLRALAAGTTNHVLTMTASGPAWAAASGSSGWALTGNSSTSAATNYLGTTDNVDFLIKTSATERMRFIGNTPQVVINSATPSAASILSVFSTTTDDALVLNANGNGRGLLINTAAATTGDAFEIQKAGTAGTAMDVVISNTNTGTGVSVAHSGTGRVANFAQLNPASGTQAVAITNQGPAIVLQVQNGLATSNLPVINASQVSTQTAATAASVYATSSSSTGGYFTANKSTNNTRALQGISNATGNFDPIGVYGEASTVNAGFGYGVVGTGNSFGLYANGDVGASGTKPFQIDHPLDPANKYLKHYSMESPEVLNIYRGSVLLNASGEADIQLPDYFHAININFTYVLTPVGAPADMYVKTEVDNTGRFVIAGGKPGLKVSWYVYAERNDAYMQQKPWKKEVEVKKKEHEVGKYLQPELYGQPKEKGIFYRPEPTIKTEE